MVQTVMGETMAGNAPEVWVVDDDRSVRFVLATALREAGYRVSAFGDAGEALQALTDHRPPALVITDVRMPGDSGLVLLDKLKQARPNLPVIVMSAHTDVASTAGAFRGGAHEFLSKPFDLDEAVALARRALPQAEELATPAPPPMSGDEFPALVGDAPAMRALFRAIGRLAQAPLSVLVTGETGTGKELVARALHRESPRASKPFVALNTAAIPSELLESELFGHEKGAFTGAHAQRIGRFEEASEGTIFLDEIAEMSPQLQAKLLRVTQNGTFQRVGSNRELRTGARILTATNRNLEELVKAGKFREDLFYRLNVVELNIPPLRERREDILPLASHFIAELAKGRARFSEAVTECLQRYPWPGNVRELRNAMERAVLLSRSELILPEHLPSRVRELAGQAPAPANGDARQLEEIERQAILQALRQHNYNRTETAKALGISRRALIYKLQRFRKMGFEIDPV